MSGINFKPFQISTSVVKQSTVKAEVKNEETKETQQKQQNEQPKAAPANTQASSLNLISSYNQAFIAKPASTTAKTAETESTNQTGDKQISEDRGRRYNKNRFMRLWEKGKLKAGDWTIFKQGGQYVCTKVPLYGIGQLNKTFDTYSEAVEEGKRGKY